MQYKPGLEGNQTKSLLSSKKPFPRVVPGQVHMVIKENRGIVCVCVCMCVGEGEREREREREIKQSSFGYLTKNLKAWVLKAHARKEVCACD